jgi:hypothetical protein
MKVCKRETGTHLGKVLWIHQQPREVIENGAQWSGPTHSKLYLQPRDFHQWKHLDKTLHLCITRDCTFWGSWQKGTLPMWMGWGRQIVSTNSRDPTNTSPPEHQSPIQRQVSHLAYHLVDWRTQTYWGWGRAMVIENSQLLCEIYAHCCWNCEVDVTHLHAAIFFCTFQQHFCIISPQLFLLAYLLFLPLAAVIIRDSHKAPLSL